MICQGSSFAAYYDLSIRFVVTKGSACEDCSPSSEMATVQSVLNQPRIRSSSVISPWITDKREFRRVMTTISLSQNRPLNSKRSVVRAVISKDQEVKVAADEPNGTKMVDVKAVVSIRKKLKEGIVGMIEDQLELFRNGFGQGITLQLVSNKVDQDTNGTKKSPEVAVKGWLPKHPDRPDTLEYTAEFTVDPDFGLPGAVFVTNLHDKEFYLMKIMIQGFDEGPIFFPAYSWVHSHNDNPEKRVFFSNQTYLPSQTPSGLDELRKSELVSIRGDGQGERKQFERIYDYATYNDLGNPDKDIELLRPVLGGTGRPYPRRCRTGRPPTKSDPLSESRVEKPHPVYVPRDENFEEVKQSSFSAGRLKAVLHNLVPSLAAALSRHDSPFSCFSDIDKLYNEGISIKHDENEGFFESLLLPRVLKEAATASKRLLKYKIPAVISRDKFAWLRDNEFARQTLAGVNPVNIERVKKLPVLSKLDATAYGSPKSAITEELLQRELHGVTVEQAIEDRRLFILDYHDMLLPYIKKMNSLEGRKAYASRTVFFLTTSGTLTPIAIELSLPPTPSMPRNKHVYTPGHDATSHWAWKMAKAHVCSNDAGIHQLASHWLRTHACVEPYIIATNRQLSSMHPIYKLLHPHMRYTLEINALARQSLINGGGIIEECFSPGKYALELSSDAYKTLWRFDMEGLPADLIRRGMAVEDPSSIHGVKLVIEDYPYAADGLLIWSAIKDWVEDYVSHFYSEPRSVKSDTELQCWWDEIKNKGHPDKRNEPWWPQLNAKEDLCGILTTMIWVSSGQHAAVNFGQYPYGGYMPNRPTLMRKLIPREDQPEFENLLLNPQGTLLASLPTQIQATKIMAVKDTLSTHSPDEEYLGQMQPYQVHWTNEQEVQMAFDRFAAKIEEIEAIIHRRNKDTRLKNRTGAGIPPYELLLPTSGPGVTGRGIPNSVSI